MHRHLRRGCRQPKRTLLSEAGSRRSHRGALSRPQLQPPPSARLSGAQPPARPPSEPVQSAMLSESPLAGPADQSSAARSRAARGPAIGPAGCWSSRLFWSLTPPMNPDGEPPMGSTAGSRWWFRPRRAARQLAERKGLAGERRQWSGRLAAEARSHRRRSWRR